MFTAAEGRRRYAVFLFKHSGKVKRVAETARAGNRVYRHIRFFGGLKELRGTVETQAEKVLVGRGACGLLEQLPYIIVTVRKRPQIVVQLIAAVMVILPDFRADFINQSALPVIPGFYTEIQKSGDQRTVCRKQTAVLPGVHTEIVQCSGKGVQNKMVGVVIRQKRLSEAERRILHGHPDAQHVMAGRFFAERIRGHNRDLTFFAGQNIIVEAKTDAAFQAVEQFPAWKRAPFPGRKVQKLLDAVDLAVNINVCFYKDSNYRNDYNVTEPDNIYY